ncbi:MAG: hypothetical protein RBS51_05260 [Anaerovoracaceae bacterium]|jgi:hypothetical protein|nr:hypothetical protein [Anaerovoracaceae bacterium]
MAQVNIILETELLHGLFTKDSKGISLSKDNKKTCHKIKITRELVTL